MMKVTTEHKRKKVKEIKHQTKTNVVYMSYVD